MQKLVIIILFACLVFAGNVFAGTRQSVYNYGTKYVPVLTYVFKNSRNITKFKKPVVINKIKYSAVEGLANLARIMNNDNTTMRMKAIKFKPETLTIYGFRFNSYKVNNLLAKKLKRIKNLISKKRFSIKSITGYTDHFGTEEYNSQLAMERAESVEDYLSLKNIKLYGYGKCCYISKHNFKDRRVVIYGLEKF